MAEATLNVKLIDKTENALALIYSSCRQCYSSKFAGDIYAKAKKLENPEEISKFIRKVVASGHESPLEHVKFTFSIEGVSRTLTHQLVRHRLASYSQQSQRYVKQPDFDYVIPPLLKKDNRLKTKFTDLMELIRSEYCDMQSILKERGLEGEIVNQDLRFILPQAVETKIVVTMNLRELKHFFGLRCCTRAQWEIRDLADQMLAICKKQLPEVFSELGAKCEELKYCPEGHQFSCGKYPDKEDLLNRPAYSPSPQVQNNWGAGESHQSWKHQSSSQKSWENQTKEEETAENKPQEQENCQDQPQTPESQPTEQETPENQITEQETPKDETIEEPTQDNQINNWEDQHQEDDT